jgi:hypothetical protein
MAVLSQLFDFDKVIMRLPMRGSQRQSRLHVLEALELRARQFHGREEVWPFRVPHEPLDLHAIVAAAVADDQAPVDADAVRSRAVLRMEWHEGHAWDLWVISLPSGISLYCDSDGEEIRVLASAKRGNPTDADGFFLERLAESRGHLFGIEMAGAPPDRIRSSISDRELLVDVFVELFEGTSAERDIRRRSAQAAAHGDFRTDVALWLPDILVAPSPGRHQPRLAEALFRL